MVTTIHVISASAILGELLSIVLAQSGFGEVSIVHYNSIGDAEAAALHQDPPDLVMVYIYASSFHNSPGYTRWLEHNIGAGIRTIVFTDLTDMASVRKLFSVGVHGLLHFNASLNELRDAMAKVNSGERYVGGQMWDNMVQGLMGSEQQQPEQNGLDEIEIQVLGAMCINRVSLEAIGHLLGFQPGEIWRRYHTIKVKLELNCKPQLIAYGLAQGYDKLYLKMAG